MLHGRVVWPRGQGAHGVSNPTVASIDEASIEDIPGVQIVRRNNFVGVVAEREWDAVRAARQLKVTWQPFAAALPGHEGLFDSFRAAKTNDVIDTDTGDVDAALARAAHVVSATYRGPVPVARHDGAELRRRRRDERRRARDVLEPRDLSDALRPRAVTGLAARQDPGAVRRRLEHLRQQLLRRRRARGRDPVAGGRQARAPPVQPRGRVRLGQLRPRASVRRARGRRRRRQARRPRLSGLEPRDGLARNGVAARARHAAADRRLRRAGSGPGPRRTVLGPPVADGHVRRAESPHRQSRRHRRRLLADRRVARADGSVDVLRARRRDRRARARREARSVRVPQAQHLARALARRPRGGGRAPRSGHRASRPRSVRTRES